MWMRDLALVRKPDNKLDWKRLLREAGLGETQQYVIKDRWGANPEQMAAIGAALRRLELKRPTRTPTGARVLALDEWIHIGRALVHQPDRMRDEIDRLTPIAEKLTQRAQHTAAIAELDAVISKQTPEPKRPRK